jgi:hypothetical protein
MRGKNVILFSDRWTHIRTFFWEWLQEHPWATPQRGGWAW